MDTLTVLTRLASLAPNVALSAALDFATEVTAAPTIKTLYDVTTHEGRVAYGRTLHSVMQHLPDRKIQAIKALREALHDAGVEQPHSGLKACKEAVDALAPATDRWHF